MKVDIMLNKISQIQDKITFFSHIQIVNSKSVIISVFFSVCVYACEYSKMKPIIFCDKSKHDKKNES